MLGNISKKLRLMGYDSEFAEGKSDDEIIKIIQKQDRILITKDEELSKRIERLGINSIFVTGNDELEHFKKIKDDLKLKRIIINGSISRCTVCNGKLKIIKKEQIKDNILPKIFERQNNFWQCTSCQKFYREGTHITHLQNFVRIINE